MSEGTAIALIDWADACPGDVAGLPALTYFERVLARVGVTRAVVVASARDALPLLTDCSRVILCAAAVIPPPGLLQRLAIAETRQVVVLDNRPDTQGYELIDNGHRWAGWLALDAATVREALLDLHPEWSVSSTLLRRSIQLDAERLLLSPSNLARENDPVSSVGEGWSTILERRIVVPIARRLVDLDLAQRIPALALPILTGLLLAIAGLGAASGHYATSALAFLLGLIGAEGWSLRRERQLAVEPGTPARLAVIAGVLTLLAGAGDVASRGGQWGNAAVGLFVILGLALDRRLFDRPVPVASVAAIMLPFALAGQFEVGLCVLVGTVALRLWVAAERRNL